MPTISVIIPTYNAAEFLHKTLDSVLAQTRKPLEIIIVDDCSTDTTRGYAHQYRLTHPEIPIQIVTTISNRGAGAARNKGISLAKGDYIAFLDADDLWTNEHLAITADLLDRHETADVAFGRVKMFGLPHLEGRLLYQDQQDQLVYNTPQPLFWYAVSRCVTQPSSCIIRRETLIAHGSFNPSFRLAEDYELFLRLSEDVLFVPHGTVTTHWRRRASDPEDGPSWQCAKYRASSEFLKQKRQFPLDEARFQQIILEDWVHCLSAAWYSNNPKHFRQVLAEGKYVAGSSKAAIPWKLRQVFRQLQPVWLKIKKPFTSKPAEEQTAT